MALTVGILRGGSNLHETTSEEANAIATDFVAQGIVGSVGNSSGVAPATGGFAVNASSGMTITIGSGVAYVTGTPSSQNSQTFRVKNSSATTTAISANSSGNTKYDWVYIKLDPTNLHTPNTAADNVATIVVSRSSSPSTDDGTPPTYGYALAVVTVANGAVSITNGNIRDIRSQVALNTGTSNAVDGWTAAGEAWTVSSGYNQGNKEYQITISGDKTGKYSAGMKLKMARGTTPPTQCTELRNTSSQTAVKTSPSGITFTDNFTCEAWIKPRSYTSSSMDIVSRRPAGVNNGWDFAISNTGQVQLTALNGANFRQAVSYQSIPLNQWVHVAASWSLSTGSAAIYINGVPVTMIINNTGSPTSLVQSGDLSLGSRASTEYIDGKLADVRVWNAVRTATQIRDNMNQQLVGNEANLVGYWKLDGNFNDSTANANNLTAQNGATATNTDNPMNATEYGIVTKVSYSAPNTTLTVSTGTSCNIPNLTLSTPYYSTHTAPSGLPSDLSSNVGRRLCFIVANSAQATSSTSPTQFNPVTNYTFTVPSNCNAIKVHVYCYAYGTGSGNSHFALYNGSISTGNLIAQWYKAASDMNLSGIAVVPVVPGSTITLNASFWTSAGTATWNSFPGGSAHQGVWVEAA